ncbi:MAG TPA: zf-HC2 domain-containing protein [Candidatus Angelobacter sp.]|nr:zf-HC2 domain-containing protein [Candidatus Angelobacter sp.]
MKCNDFLKELTDYLDGTATVEVRVELEEHLQWCNDCYVVMNTTKKTIEIYRDNQIYELPESLRSKLHQAILTKCRHAKPGNESSK